MASFFSTFIFDAEGTPCVTFDPEPHLEEPLTAFVAGDLTTSTGITGPSLVYLDTGGKVVAYHGLLEQVRTTCLKFSCLAWRVGRKQRQQLKHPSPVAHAVPYPYVAKVGPHAVYYYFTVSGGCRGFLEPPQLLFVLPSGTGPT